MAAGPVNLVNLERARLAFATRVILDDVSLGVAAGDRIGVVGRNGGGKSTLLRVLAGLQPVDDGRVTQTGGLTVAVLGQDDELDPAATVRDVRGRRPGRPRVGRRRPGPGRGERAARRPRRRRRSAAWTRWSAPMSGGERRRIALARHLVADPDLLLLDEPTNHLDVEGVAWLARHLAARRPTSALVAITHDRWFLDAMATTTWEVHDGSVDAYDGGYAAYVLARAERARVAADDRGAPAEPAAQGAGLAAPRAAGPDQQAEVPDRRRQRAGRRRARRRATTSSCSASPPAGSARTSSTCTACGVQLGDRVLLDDVTWLIGPGDRIGVVGVNGVGQVDAAAGAVRRRRARRRQGQDRAGRSSWRSSARRSASSRRWPSCAWWTPSPTSARRRTWASGRSPRPSWPSGSASPASASSRLVKELSGGERRRLQLLRLLMDEPNVLLLDEPTNDLDVDTLTALEDLLDGWAGTLVVVSHDRYALERMCDRQVALLGDGRLRDLPGGVEEYLHLRAAGLARRGPRSVASERNARYCGDRFGRPGAHRRGAARGPQGDGPPGAAGGADRAAGRAAARRDGRPGHRPRRGRPSWTSGCAACSPSARTPSPAGSTAATSAADRAAARATGGSGAPGRR